MMNQKTAIIPGAGTAGLTAAYELLTKADIKPIIYETSKNNIWSVNAELDYHEE